MSHFGNDNGETMAEQGAVYRVCKVYPKGDKPKKYRGSFEVIDECTGAVVARCDLVGQAAFSTVAITDHEDRAWLMKPNRKVMPSRWVVTDPGQRVAVQFDLRLKSKLLNPLHRVALALLDGEGEEMCCLMDLRVSLPDRMLSTNPDEWVLVKGEEPIARLVDLPARMEPPKGVLGKLKAFLTPSDKCVVSEGGRHALPAQVALFMVLLVNEVATGND